MKPIKRHPELAPGRHGVSLESMGDLAIIAAGLKHISASPETTPEQARLAADKAADLDGVRAKLGTAFSRQDLHLSPAFAFSVAIVDTVEVDLTEMAAHAVADNAPGTTDSPYLQDPLQHDSAIDMRDAYMTQLEQMQSGGEAGGPPQPPES